MNTFLRWVHSAISGTVRLRSIMPPARFWRLVQLSKISGDFPAAEFVGDAYGIVMPGLVNAHDHLSEGLISGIGETLNLYEWQHRLIGPVGPQLTRDFAMAGAMLKGLEMVQSGITTVNDMFVHVNPGRLGALGSVDGIEKIGMRGVVSFGAHDLTVPVPVPALIDEHHALAQRCAEAQEHRFSARHRHAALAER